VWKLTSWAKTRSPLSGIPWRDLTDEEFEAAEAQFPEGLLREAGYFYREERPDEDGEESEDVEPSGPRRQRPRRVNTDG